MCSLICVRRDGELVSRSDLADWRERGRKRRGEGGGEERRTYRSNCSVFAVMLLLFQIVIEDFDVQHLPQPDFQLRHIDRLTLAQECQHSARVDHCSGYHSRGVFFVIKPDIKIKTERLCKELFSGDC